MSASPMNPQGGPPPVQKKTSPWIFALIGCAGLIVVAGIAMVALGVFAVHKAKEAGIDPELMRDQPALAAAKIIAAANPDVEIVDVDERSERITLREKSTGKTVTLDLAAVRKGRISFETDEGKEVSMEVTGEGEEGKLTMESEEGTVQIGGAASVTLPSWIKPYPGSEPKGVMSSDTAEGKSGTVTFNTNDSAESVMDFFKTSLEDAGFTVNTVQQGGASTGGMVTGESSDGARNAMIVIAPGESGVNVNVTYREKQ